MLTRSAFESIDTIPAALTTLGVELMARSTRREFPEEISRIADEVAAVHADSVDKDARFPNETFDALKEAGALSALVPEQLGGGGLGIADAAGVIRARTPVRGLRPRLRDAPDPGRVPRPALRRLGVVRGVPALAGPRAASDRLCTSEVGTGGDTGRSIAALTPADGATLTFEKQARPSATAPTPTTS